MIIADTGIHTLFLEIGDDEWFISVLGKDNKWRYSIYEEDYTVYASEPMTWWDGSPYERHLGAFNSFAEAVHFIYCYLVHIVEDQSGEIEPLELFWKEWGK